MSSLTSQDKHSAALPNRDVGEEMRVLYGHRPETQATYADEGARRAHLLVTHTVLQTFNPKLGDYALFGILTTAARRLWPQNAAAEEAGAKAAQDITAHDGVSLGGWAVDALMYAGAAMVALTALKFFFLLYAASQIKQKMAKPTVERAEPLNVQAFDLRGFEPLRAQVENNDSRYITLLDNNHLDLRPRKILSAMMPEFVALGVSDFVLEGAGLNTREANAYLKKYFEGEISDKEFLQSSIIKVYQETVYAAKKAGVRIWFVDPRGDHPQTDGAQPVSLRIAAKHLSETDKEIARRIETDIVPNAKGRIAIFYGRGHFSRKANPKEPDAVCGIEGALGRHKVTQIDLFGASPASTFNLFQEKDRKGLEIEKDEDFALEIDGNAVVIKPGTRQSPATPAPVRADGICAKKASDALRP